MKKDDQRPDDSLHQMDMPTALVLEIYTWLHEGPMDDWHRRCTLHRTLGDMLGEPRVEYHE